MNIYNEFQALFTLHGFVSLVILSLLELVLGIDNIIFISLVIAKLPETKRVSARVAGLALALIMRIAMLFGLVWLSKIATVLFTLANFQVTVRDILFFTGGGYLIWSTTQELKEHIRSKGRIEVDKGKHMLYKSAILQIVMVDMLFSFDSIFTAIGLMQNFVIMALAIILGMVFMLWLSGKLSAFINKHPTIKTMALAFIIAVGLLLVFSALHIELPKSYIYIAFFGAFTLELLNIQLKKKRQ
ncbi:MAG TPA: TerC family protein [Bacteroidia bacterium]|jgi:predicted tellurium resistance membrane protein TerC|nr:TerC family protein [Bacteroidia bacterium]